MKNDLISRESLYKKIVEKEELARQRVLDTPINSPCYQRYVTQLNERTAFKHMVFDEPTDYDVDAVVDKLDNMSGIQFDGKNESYQLDWCIEKNRAIDIVRKGGVE